MSMIRPLATIAGLSLLLLTGCAATAAAPEPTVDEPRTEVAWDDYAPALRDTIDNGDCATLDAEFTNAVANNDAVAARTPHNNADLMLYISEAQDLASC